MTALLTELRAQGVELSVTRSGGLGYKLPAGIQPAPILATLREHKAELLEQLQAANDPGPTSRRWRVSPPGGASFELSTWPACPLTELQADNPGAKVEPIPTPTGGTLPPADQAVIEAVCLSWNATAEELADALREAAATPALLDGWRREAEGMGLSVDRIRENGDFSTPAPPAPPLDEALSVDSDRITCQQCRRLKPGNLCGSPEWGPRYHPPARPHRCAEFQPKPGAADPRSGAQRWPGLGEMKP